MAKGKYQEWLSKEALILLEGWARDGLNDEQIAHNMGIAPTTLYDWIKKFPQISKAVSAKKEVADFEVENAMKKRAEGYDVWEEEEVWNIELQAWIPTKRKKKHIPADASAGALWLKNRQPKKWRDRPEAVEDNEIESDGLLEALTASADELMDDDSEMLPSEEE